MHVHHAVSSFEIDADRRAAPRLALAGGSDQPPPGQDQASAEVIRFPLERTRLAQNDPGETDVDDASTDDTPEAGTGALWAAWLTSVLSSPSAGVAGSER
ncbi:MAG: hypothetical protein JNL04_01460 [Rhodospirillaceae bacterium]|nr:hypothetical protein [Rhodospirillaceae bacterium]